MGIADELKKETSAFHELEHQQEIEKEKKINKALTEDVFNNYIERCKSEAKRGKSKLSAQISGSDINYYTLHGRKAYIKEYLYNDLSRQGFHNIRIKIVTPWTSFNYDTNKSQYNYIEISAEW